MKIYDGESEMARDVWSMVVITNQSPYMKIYGGEITNMPIDENLWWWNWNAHGCLIYGGKITKMPIDENLW